MSTYLHNNSKNIAALLKQQESDQINPIRTRKSEKNYKRKGFNLSLLHHTEEKSQSAQIVKDDLLLQQSNILKGRKKRRETNRQFNDTIELPEISYNKNIFNHRFQNIEKTIQKEIRRNRKIIQELQLTKMKVNENLRYVQQKHSALENKMQEKLLQLQHQINKQKSQKVEFIQKMGSLEFHHKELLNFVRILQQQCANQFNNIKFSLQKSNEQQSFYSKQKEKTNILFQEVSKIKNYEQKITISIQNLQDKFKYLDIKLSNVQKNEQKQQLNKPILDRIENLESNLSILAKQNQKNKQIGTNSYNLQKKKIYDDLKDIVVSVKNQLIIKLEDRVMQIVKRIVEQREQRLKIQEQIQRKLASKQQNINEKFLMQNNQKLQNKYREMDTQIRNQVMKINQNIKDLQQGLSNQNQIKLVELEKQNKDSQNIKKIEEQLKNIQQNVRRIQSETSKKNKQDLLQEIPQIVKNQIGKYKNQISIPPVNNNNNNNNQELPNQLNSSVVPPNITVSSPPLDEQLKKLKQSYTKLSEMFRSNLITTKSLEQKMKSMESDFQILSNQINSVINQFYKDFDFRFKQQKQAIKKIIMKQTQQDNRFLKLQEYLLSLKNKQMKKGGEQNGKYFQSNNENLKRITDDVKNVQKTVCDLQIQMKKQNENMERVLTQLKKYVINLKSEIQISNNAIHQDLNKLFEVTQIRRQKN